MYGWRGLIKSEWNGSKTGVLLEAPRISCVPVPDLWLCFPGLPLLWIDSVSKQGRSPVGWPVWHSRQPVPETCLWESEATSLANF